MAGPRRAIDEGTDDPGAGGLRQDFLLDQLTCDRRGVIGNDPCTSSLRTFCAHVWYVLRLDYWLLEKKRFSISIRIRIRIQIP